MSRTDAKLALIRMLYATRFYRDWCPRHAQWYTDCPCPPPDQWSIGPAWVRREMRSNLVGVYGQSWET